VDASKVQSRRAEVDETDKPAHTCAVRTVDQMPEILRNSDDQRDMKTAIVDVTLAAGQYTAMVAEIEDECVLE
jgi:hypothetical protein